MNYLLDVTLFVLLTFFPQQAQQGGDVQGSCPMHNSHGPLAESQHMAAEATQSAEQRHHAFLDEERGAIGRGEGFGMAFVADHNGYPGPRHILDLQAQLRLSADQTAAVQELFSQMKEQAVARGKEVLQAEEELEKMFRERRPEAELREQVRRVAFLRAELRWIHLQAHLSAAKLLTNEQIAAYSQVRHGGHHTPGTD